MKTNNSLSEKTSHLFKKAGNLLDVWPEEVMSIVHYSRLSACMSTLNAIVVTLGLWTTERGTFFSIWLIASSFLFFSVAFKSARAENYLPKRISSRALKLFSLYTLMHALPWVILAFVCITPANMRENLIVIMVCGGMSFSGGFLLYRVPLAALLYSGTIIASVALSIAINNFYALWPLIAFAGTYAFALSYIIMVSWRIAREREKSLFHANKANEKMRDANREVRRLAMNDTLTNLPNRNAFTEILERKISENDTGKLAVLLLDIDRFKNINDCIGHHAGDKLLKIMKSYLQNIKQDTDTLARFGGDEFALLIDLQANEGDGQETAERILERLSTPVLIDGVSIYPNASIGISIYPEHGRQGFELIRHADMALDQAKKKGRGRYELYSEELRITLTKTEETEGAIRKAFADNRVEMYYQPKVDMHNGNYTGAEALIRWFDENGEPANIMDLLNVSAERGLIPQLSNFVFERVTQDILDWKKHGIQATPISINVHPNDLKTPHLLLNRLRTMLDAGIRNTDIILEVTEGCFVGQGSDEAEHALDKISHMGIKLSLDDFGTGHAALSHLKYLPVGELKVDREFIREICQDARDQAITTAAFEISRFLKIDCVAEGVETEEQAQALRTLHKGKNKLIGQGYLWARPMPAGDFSEYIKSHQITNIDLNYKTDVS